MLQKLGFEQLDADLATALVNQTIDLLSAVQVASLLPQFEPEQEDSLEAHGQPLSLA
ncbi:hypothetical protein [Leptolyngbya sp. KIOST-1]|uniref:hypothetical protein n=1 Tax=Leptolyngbya sp. KIOST-1 TaxID=1229172 RepID=UPI000B1E0F06|nr:hypothetical protein [Leptolyngbya sp. KIOST-1]